MGIAVFNAPYSNTRSVVELAIGEIIDLSRRVTVKNSRLHRGVWDKSADGAHEVRGHTLGIIGYGNIGTQLSVLAEAMGLNVIFYDAAERLALGNATQMPTMEAVLREADIISVHVDGQESNTNLIGRVEFELMKPGALFINLSRGHVVDVDALHAALVSGHLGGAAIDVFPQEPRANGDPFSSPLATLDNVILTPHIGGSTEEAQYDIGRQRIHRHERQPAEPDDERRQALALPRAPHPPQRPRRHGARQPNFCLLRSQRRRTDPGHPRRGRLRAHRHFGRPGTRGT